MDREIFETTLKAFQIREPFTPFLIELVSGLEFTVQRPEAVHTYEGAAVYFSPRGEIRLFDSQSVSSFCDLQKKPAVSGNGSAGNGLD